ncbi:MAG: SDR family NAD(P)-dependent oxidoreductase [Dehalococcoidia bacterium]|nr:SDR family NAD(P)-dependent oxidoreductase [Dehalococcoidia bacterium]
MANRLAGKSAVVTGAGGGIGRGIALLLATEGAHVVVNDPGANLDGSGHDNGPADQVVSEIKAAGGTAVSNYDSVATSAGGENIIKTALDSFSRIDILVNVAGILRDRMIFNMSEEEWDAVIAVHLKGHYTTTKPASVMMRQQRYGRIINFSSSSGLVGNAGQANYGAAKAGIAGFTRVVARDLGRYGVTCNAISPTASSRMTESVPDQARALRARAGIAAGTTAPLSGTAGDAPVAPREPEYIAPMVAWLASDAAWNVNGKVFLVTGGSISLAAEEVPLRTLDKAGMWTVDELEALVPSYLMKDLPNPAPPAADLEVAGRPKA